MNASPLPRITDSWNASLTNFVSLSVPNSRSAFVLFSVNNRGGCLPSGPLSISNLNTSSSETQAVNTVFILFQAPALICAKSILL